MCELVACVRLLARFAESSRPVRELREDWIDLVIPVSSWVLVVELCVMASLSLWAVSGDRTSSESIVDRKGATALGMRRSLSPGGPSRIKSMRCEVWAPLGAAAGRASRRGPVFLGVSALPLPEPLISDEACSGAGVI